MPRSYHLGIQPLRTVTRHLTSSGRWNEYCSISLVDHTCGSPHTLRRYPTFTHNDNYLSTLRLCSRIKVVVWKNLSTVCQMQEKSSNSGLVCSIFVTRQCSHSCGSLHLTNARPGADPVTRRHTSRPRILRGSVSRSSASKPTVPFMPLLCDVWWE